MKRLLILLVVLSACRHTRDDQVSEGSSAVIASELVIGSEVGEEVKGMMQAIAIDGYQFEYVAAANEKAHLVRVKRASGVPLSVSETAELAKLLQQRKGIRYVELNQARSPQKQ